MWTKKICEGTKRNRSDVDNGHDDDGGGGSSDDNAYAHMHEHEYVCFGHVLQLPSWVHSVESMYFESECITHLVKWATQTKTECACRKFSTTPTTSSFLSFPFVFFCDTVSIYRLHLMSFFKHSVWSIFYVIRHLAIF